MPNHVDQDLYIKGSAEEIKEFMEFAKDGEKVISADRFIPYPQHFKDLDKKASLIRAEAEKTGDYSLYSHIKDGFNSGGYEWCRENWGTKWGIYDAKICNSKFTGKTGKVKYNYNSAWTPTNLIVLAMSKKFPNLEFKLKYFECGMQFKGTMIFKEGVVVETHESSYKGSRGG